MSQYCKKKFASHMKTCVIRNCPEKTSLLHESQYHGQCKYFVESIRGNSNETSSHLSLFTRTHNKEATAFTSPRLRNWAHTSQSVILPNVRSILIRQQLISQPYKRSLYFGLIGTTFEAGDILRIAVSFSWSQPKTQATLLGQ